MLKWNAADLSPFSESRDDHKKIDGGKAVPCRICEDASRRLRLTYRYCSKRNKGACEGEHLTFVTNGRNVTARCVIFGSKRDL
jgi:hypothetical protein